MSQNPRSPPAIMGPGHRPRPAGAIGERGKPAPSPPRGFGGASGHAGLPGVTPPPIPQYQAGFRSTTSQGSSNPNGRSNVPPPPPYPPPPQHQAFYYGTMPQGATSFDYQPGITPVARMYGFGYGPPQPPGMPMVAASQPVYPGYPQGVPYPNAQLIPAAPEMLGSRSRPQRSFGSPSDAKVVGHDRSFQRSPRSHGASMRREPRPGPPTVPTSETPPVAEVSNAAGLPVRPGRPDCKHYLSHGWCSYGRVCKYNHSEVPTSNMPPQPPGRPLGHGQSMMGLALSPWVGMGMQYPVYGWPMPQMPVGADPGLYGPGWGYQSTPTIIYYPPAGPQVGKAGKRYSQPANCSARSCDSAASSSSRMLDPNSENLSEPKAR